METNRRSKRGCAVELCFMLIRARTGGWGREVGVEDEMEVELMNSHAFEARM